MKAKDFYFLGILLVLAVGMCMSSGFISLYNDFNDNHGVIMSFIKFSILATLGEIIALRIKEGVYIKAGFGILPKMLVWGILGIFIKLAFVIFAKGTPYFLQYVNVPDAVNFMNEGVTLKAVFVSFSISFSMNIMFAPVMMTVHKITDLHINKHNGAFSSLFRRIDVVSHFRAIDWNIMWGFVFKKTIPLFWIPAHTITFLLPVNYQILIAALLSIVLGIILSIASLKK